MVNGGLESVAGRVARLLIAIFAGLDGALILRPSQHISGPGPCPVLKLDKGQKKSPRRNGG